MDGNALFAVVSFVVGLAIGLWQLYLAQRQFEQRQETRMEEIRRFVVETQNSISVIRELTTQRSFDFQDKLLSFAAQQRAINSATQEGADSIRHLITEELQNAGVSDAVERTKALEAKLNDTLGKVAETAATPNFRINLTPTEIQVMRHYASLDQSQPIGKIDQMTERIAQEMGMSTNEIEKIMDNIYGKFGVEKLISKDELSFFLLNIYGLIDDAEAAGAIF